jgi:hypothetical protein
MAVDGRSSGRGSGADDNETEEKYANNSIHDV